MKLIRIVSCMVGAVVIPAGPALAVVNAVDASVSSEVTEFVDGRQLNFDSAFEDLGDTDGAFPVTAESSLARTPDDRRTAAGTASATLRDPRTATTPNPEEFVIRLLAYSDESDVAYDTVGDAVETRDITFEASEMELDADTELLVRSFFFLDGVVVLWTTDAEADLSGAASAVSLQIDQVRGGGEPGRLLDASVSLTGDADGGAVLATDGTLQPGNVVLLDLSDQVSFGRLYVLVLPELVVEYLYNADVDESFQIRATLHAESNAAPKTAAAVLLGVDETDLAGEVSALVGEDIQGEWFEVVLPVLDARPVPDQPLSGERKTVVQPVFAGLPIGCGALGGELGLIATGLVAIPLARRRRVT